jgi:signal transduction histidine kinase
LSPENDPQGVPSAASPESLKVLIIDDSEADAFLFRQIVREIGEQNIDVDHCCGYDDGLSALNDKKFDVAFIDYHLGVHSGTELISAAGGRSCPTPLVLLTGQFGWVVEQQGIEAGAVDFVDKNILSPQLLRRVIGYAQQNHNTARDLIVNLESYRNLAQSAARANSQKSLFFAEMSHELRTPLNAIVGFSEILKGQMLGPFEGASAERYTGYAKDIYDSSQHLLGLIDDLLDLSKFEGGTYDADIAEVSVGDLLEDLVTMTADEAAAAGVGVTATIAGEFMVPNFDRRLMLQALFNVTLNGIKFSERGGGVSVLAEALSGGLVIKVIDSGCGIAEEELDSVLLSYRQGSAMKTRPGGGTGLGLALSRSILELHHGHVSIESELGVGTVVTLYLPIHNLPMGVPH